MVIPLHSPILVNWFLDAFPPAPCGQVSTVGSGPYPEADFDQLLERGGLEIWSIEEAPHFTDVLIIGRTDWDEEQVNTLLDALEGDRLRVYSQEMFLLYWMSGTDPFDDPDVARSFGEGHPALEYLSTRWLHWPSTFVSIRESGTTGEGLFIDSPGVGILSYMGYRVGERGVSETERREILDRVFHSTLPRINSQEYMNQWGKPKSRERLKKMADSIAAFCQSQKRRGNDIPAEHYEEDLDWLRRKYYSGRFKFQWPHTRIG